MNFLSCICGFDKAIKTTLENLGVFSKLPISKKRVILSHPSKFADNGSINGAITSTNIPPDFIEALFVYKGIKDGKTEGGVGTAKNEAFYVSECNTADHVITVVYDRNNYQLRGLVVDDDNSSGEYIVKKTVNSATPIILALFPILMEEPEFEEFFNKFEDFYDRDFPESEFSNVLETLGVLSQNFYYRLKGTSASNANYSIEVVNSADGKIPLIPNSAIMNRTFAPDNVIVGHFTVLSNATSHEVRAKAASDRAELNKSFMGKYSIHKGDYTSEEEARIAPIPDNFVIPPELIDLAESISMSDGNINTINLKGPAGTGKSAMASVLASMLGLPKSILTCNAALEMADITGQILPVEDSEETPEIVEEAFSSYALTAEEQSIYDKIKISLDPSLDDSSLDFRISCFLHHACSNEISKIFGLPSTVDVLYDTESVYLELSGESKNPFDSEELLLSKTQELFNSIIESKRDLAFKISYKAQQYKQQLELHNLRAKYSQSQNKQTRYEYIESDFVKAVRNGWLIEIQEPNVISNPGTLVGLNGLLEEGVLTLPTGEVLHRHPSNIIIFSSNINYSGCRQVNQSVIDRSQISLLLKDLPLPVMVERAMAKSGYTDEAVVTEMATIVKDIARMMNEEDISDGVCGMRSLTNWALLTKLKGNPYEQCIKAVINKVSDDEEFIDAAMERLNQSSFYPSRRRKTH